MGALLDIPEGVLESIEYDYGHWGQLRCCNEMFAEWVSRDTGASWKKLHAVLKSPAIGRAGLLAKQPLVVACVT